MNVLYPMVVKLICKKTDYQLEAVVGNEKDFTDWSSPIFSEFGKDNFDILVFGSILSGKYVSQLPKFTASVDDYRSIRK